MKRLKLITTLITLLCLFSILTIFTFAKADESQRQIISGNSLKDFDYGFELKTPNADWVLIGEKQIKQLVPDAIAGIHNYSKRIYCAVIAEEMQEHNLLHDYADLLIDISPLENKTIVYKKEFPLEGRQAYQYQLKGEFNSIKLTYLITLFRNQGFNFQVASWWLDELVIEIPQDVLRIHSAFNFIPGIRPQVRIAAKKKAMMGVGWRIKGNVYENGISGLRLKLPSEQWSFIESDELKSINPDAIIGIKNPRFGIYIEVVAERLENMKEEMYVKFMVDGFIKENSPKKHLTQETMLGGKKLTRHLFEEVGTSNIKTDFSMVITKNKEFGFQVNGWWFRPPKTGTLNELSRVYSGIEWIVGKEKRALEHELLKFGEIERTVVEDACFRKFEYINFPFGFSLKIPGGFWEHFLGTDARLQNPDASLIINELQQGLYAVVILDTWEEVTPAMYHSLVLEDLKAPEKANTKILNFNGGECRATRFNINEATGTITYHLVTVTVDSKHCQLFMSGLPANMEKTKKIEKKLIEGISLSANPFPESEYIKNSSFVNRRFGYTIVPRGKNWIIKELTPKMIKGLASLVGISDPDTGNFFMVIAFHPHSNTEIPYTNLFSKIHGENKFGLVSETKIKWHGYPASIYTIYSKGKTQFFGPGRFIFSEANVGGTRYFFIQSSEVDKTEQKKNMNMLVFVP